MNNWVAISKSEHGESRWKQRDHYQMFANEIIAPILPQELGKLISDYVLGFVRAGESFQAVALLGVEEGKNLYVSSEGRWLAMYVPAAYRAFPFALANGEEDNRILCIEESYLSQDSEDQRLFDEESNLAEFTQEILGFLQSREQSYISANSATKLIVENQLLKEWPLVISAAYDSSASRMEGFYSIDEEKLNNLEASTLGTLRQHGALALAYAQLLSMSQTEQISRRLEFQRNQAQPGEAVADLSELFSANDNLNFDSL